MDDIAGWVAPVATVIAAMMTAANLGARVTGWGFAVFMIGSLSWSAVAVATGQPNLLWTNGFLTLVNAAGIWRWLGRQAKYDDGGEAAARRSATAKVPTLFSISGFIGQAVVDADGKPFGAIVDAMARCEDAALAYVVISEGGVGGVGEVVHAVDPAMLVFGEERVKCRLTEDELKALPALEPGRWPAALPE